MRWRFNGSGEWESFAFGGKDDDLLMWRIQVCEDGSFSVNESDPGLTDRKETFSTLAAAKQFCESSDDVSAATS